MASSPTFFSCIFLLTLLSINPIHARDGQFFSKIPAATTTTSIPLNNEKVPTISNKEQESFNNEKNEEPAFVKDTQNGYGLYKSQDSSYLPTTTTATSTSTSNTNNNYQPYNTQTQSQETNTNNNYYTNNRYDMEQQQNFGQSSFHENSYTITDDNNYDPYYRTTHETYANNYPKRNPNNFYYDNNAYQDQQSQNFEETSQYYNTNNNNRRNNYYNNIEKQGMSDTRFLENGRYFYDVNKDNMGNYNYHNQYKNSRANTNSYNYNNNNNNHGSSYGNYNNAMDQRFPNQEEDFEDSRDEQFVP